MADLQLTFTGAVTILNVDTDALAAALRGPIIDRINALEATMTTPLTNIDDALTALTDHVTALQTAEAADRAAFDALAAVVRAFIAAMQNAGNLTTDQQAQAQAILDSLDASATAETTEAADEAALQGEVPPAV